MSRLKCADVFPDLHRKFNPQFEEAKTTSVEESVQLS